MSHGFGAFGKMPSLGDFFRIGLPTAFLQPWDTWVQTAMVAARSALGARWTDCFLSAPLWRFSLAPGLAGPQGMTGVMMASVDRVGRQFPLTIAAPLPDGAVPQRHHLAAAPLFHDLEIIALDMLEDGMTKELLVARLAMVRLPSLSTPLSNSFGAGWAIRARDETALLADLAADQVAHTFRRSSLWSAVLADGQLMLVCEGLPDPSRATALFDMSAPLWTEGDRRE